MPNPYLTTITAKTNDLLARSGILAYVRPQPQSYTRAQLLRLAFNTALIALIIPAAYCDYESYLSLGPGGPPYNVLGWLTVKLFFNPFKREMFGTRIYDAKIENGETRSFLSDDDLPRRRGERPAMGTFAAPQRQINQVPRKAMQEVKIMAAYASFIDRNAHIVDRVPSILEKYTDAAHVGSATPLTPVAKQLKREICHVHGTSDHSVHVTLSPADCKQTRHRRRLGPAISTGGLEFVQKH
ncbi:hypothetical protein BDW74DRAFT_179985 [Aspergillus multicolor]|uniref:uncharacterized protein n=1 Tax=Aspergillus multicolor TaxID=41759 RepID=UPI003CCDE65D